MINFKKLLFGAAIVLASTNIAAAKSQGPAGPALDALMTALKKGEVAAAYQNMTSNSFRKSVKMQSFQFHMTDNGMASAESYKVVKSKTGLMPVENNAGKFVPVKGNGLRLELVSKGQTKTVGTLFINEDGKWKLHNTKTLSK